MVNEVVLAIEFETTLNAAVPVTPDCAAEITLLPAAKALTNPALFTLATVGAEELQVAEAVRFCVVPSE